MASSRKLSSTKRLPSSVFRRVSNFPSPGFSERCQPGSQATPSPSLPLSLSLLSQNPPVFSFAGKLDYYGSGLYLGAVSSRKPRIFSPSPSPSTPFLSFSTGPSTRVLLAGSKWRAVVKTTNSVGKLLVTKTFSPFSLSFLAESFVILMANRSSFR